MLTSIIFRRHLLPVPPRLVVTTAPSHPVHPLPFRGMPPPKPDKKVFPLRDDDDRHDANLDRLGTVRVCPPPPPPLPDDGYHDDNLGVRRELWVAQ